MLILACKPEPKIPAGNFSGVLRNAKGDSITLSTWLKEKKIPVRKDGSFSVNLAPDSTIYYLATYKGQHFSIYVDKHTRLTVSADANNLLNTIQFKGKGAAENNFLATAEREELALGKALPPNADITYITKAADSLVEHLILKLNASEASVKAKKVIKERLEKYKTFFMITKLDRRYVDMGLRGKPSPSFSYTDVSGKTVSLADFRGKYVYIDIWASWCETCLGEVPYLNQMKKDFAEKNLAFVSISLDDPKNKNKWKKAIAKEQMNGIQLIADNSRQSKFIKDYGIRGIPRFLLIDPEGIVIDDNAKHPGEKALVDQLNALLK